MPYPNEHACRLRSPGDFQSESFRRTTRKSDGKTYSIIMGRLKGKTTMTEQAYRYPKDVWTADAAKSHCSAHDGSFEKATGEEKGIVMPSSVVLPLMTEDTSSLHLKEIKSTDKSVIIGGYMALWGDPDNRDLELDYFTPETDFFLEYYAKAPAVFHHGKDPMVGKSILGHRDDAYKKDDGLWVQDWIDKSNEYWSIIEALLDANKLYYSPGAVPQLVDRTPERQLKAYPIADDTFTPIPAQFALGLRERSLDHVKSVYQLAGLEFTLPESLRGRVEKTLTSEKEQEIQLALADMKLKRFKLAL